MAARCKQHFGPKPVPRATERTSERLLLEQYGRPVLLARVEARHHTIAGKVAWLPQGPVYIDAESAYEAFRVLKVELKARGYQLCFENPYPNAPPRYPEHGIAIGEPAQTSVIDVSVGEEVLWNRMSANWRNNVRAAERSGMLVTEARDASIIRQFVAECERLSAAKGFRYQGNEPLVSGLLQGSGHNGVVAKLYCASLARPIHGRRTGHNRGKDHAAHVQLHGARRTFARSPAAMDSHEGGDSRERNAL